MSKELEEIENSFYKIKHFIEHVPVSSAEAYFYDIDFLEKGIKRLEKLEKFAELITKKSFQCECIIICYKLNGHFLSLENVAKSKGVIVYHEEPMTQNDYDLLKETLK